jgi:hypothetical protein
MRHGLSSLSEGHNIETSIQVIVVEVLQGLVSTLAKVLEDTILINNL